MDILIVLLLFSAIFIAAIIFTNKPRTLGDADIYPYVSKNPLTKTEVIFYKKLKAALPEFIILPQVQLSSFISVDRSLIKPNESYKWQNPLSQQSIDYLICDQEFSIVAAIELDDKSHTSHSATKRDAKKNSNLEAAQVRLIRWHAENMPDEAEIQFEVKRYLIDRPLNVVNLNSRDHDEWIIEPRNTYFDPPKVIQKMAFLSKNVYLFKILFLIFSAMMILIGVNLFSINITKLISTPPNITKSISDGITQRSNVNLQASIQRQEAKKEEEITKRKAELALQQDFNERQDQLRAEASREEAVKEELWNREYKNKLNCSDNDYAVECGNAYIKARQKFEAYWQTNKPKHLN